MAKSCLPKRGDQMKEWMREVWQTFRYRITHTSKFPKGDLTAFLLNLARRGW